MSKPNVDLARIAAVFAKHDVDFVVVGGMAVVLHGGETTTWDIDLAFSKTGENVERLADALQELSAKPKRWVAQKYRLTSADLASRWLHLESDSGDIDLIANTPGLSYEQVKEGSDSYNIEGERIQVASVADLIEMKRDTGRDKDARQVAELEELRKLTVDDS